MPRRLPSSCLEPRCPVLCLPPRCPEHTKGDRKRRYQIEKHQRDPQDRYYSTARWQKLRAMQLATEPLCRRCQANGRVVPATVADHVIPRKAGGEDGLDNMQSLCFDCHAVKTADDRGRGTRKVQ